MGIILSLETTTTNCSVALGKDGKTLAIREDKSQGYSHAEKLHLFIDEVIKESGLKLKDIDAVAVSKGPGSYTGLRIGVSAAKGLCFSLDIPLISIPTLDTLARQVDIANYKNPFIVPMLDARRMEVYTAVYDKSYHQVKDTQAKILEADSYLEYLEKSTTVFIGDGAKKFQDICSHPNAVFIDALPSSREMVALAENKYQKSDTEDVAYFEPYYLKDFIVG